MNQWKLTLTWTENIKFLWFNWLLGTTINIYVNMYIDRLLLSPHFKNMHFANCKAMTKTHLVKHWTRRTKENWEFLDPSNCRVRMENRIIELFRAYCIPLLTCEKSPDLYINFERVNCSVIPLPQWTHRCGFSWIKIELQFKLSI